MSKKGGIFIKYERLPVKCSRKLAFLIISYIIVSMSKEFAIIATGGKQYKVSVGDTLKIEKIKGDLKAGDEVIFEKVLLVDNGKDTTIGTPHIAGAKVTATLVKMGKNKTIKVVKYKQKSRYLKQNGHRQPFAEIKITSIK